MLECKECGFKDEKSILSHVRQVHGMTVEEYKREYDSPLRVAAAMSNPDFSQKFSEMGKKNTHQAEAAKLPIGQWSRQSQSCVSCFKTDLPHKAKGLCKRCYSREAMREDRAQQSN